MFVRAEYRRDVFIRMNIVLDSGFIQNSSAAQMWWTNLALASSKYFVEDEGKGIIWPSLLRMTTTQIFESCKIKKGLYSFGFSFFFLVLYISIKTMYSPYHVLLIFVNKLFCPSVALGFFDPVIPPVRVNTYRNRMVHGGRKIKKREISISTAL